MAQYFDILQDKYGSPYFTNPEKSLLINRAQVIFVKELLPTEPNQIINLENTQNTLNEVSSLIIRLNPISSIDPSSGLVSFADIQTELTARSAGAVLWRILSIGYSRDSVNFTPVKYVRHNDWFEFQDNYFKSPDQTNPKVVEYNAGFQLLPLNISTSLYFFVLKYPKNVDIDTVISSDLPDYTHDKIVAIALELAGIGTRDQMLSGLTYQRQKDVN